MSEDRNWSGRHKGVRSALLLLAAAAIASLWPDPFILDRAAVRGGELWRLWTGHLVHLNAEHFVFDVGAALVLCFFLPVGRALLFFAPLVSVIVLALRPEVQAYSGLSGVLHGLTVLAALRLAARREGALRLFCLAIGFGTLAKAILETATGEPLLTSGVSMGAPTIFLAHLVGATAGLLAVYARQPGLMGHTAAAR